MQAVNRYSLLSSSDGNRTTMLVRDGRTLAAEVEGIILNTQFELRDGSTLISLTDDSPYDEGLHIYLLNKDGFVEDAIEAGADFSPGILKIGAVGEDWIEFEFFTNETIYRLEITQKPQLRFCLPAGCRYKKQLKTHRLVIYETPKGKA